MEATSTAPSEASCAIPPIQCKNAEMYGSINTLIYEYLEVNGLEQSLKTFARECASKNLPCPALSPVKCAFTHYDGDQLLKHFDNGTLGPFLALWGQFQNHIQVTSEDMKKLEVYLRVHFAIYPKAKSLPEEEQVQAMTELKSFFEQNSATLSNDATILPLFALPFVADPRPHPIFKDLFQDSWTGKLRSQLKTTVNKYFELLQENISSHCQLAKMVEKGSIKKVGVGIQAAIPVEKKSSISRSNTVVVAGPKEEVGGGQLHKMAEAAVDYHRSRFWKMVQIHTIVRQTLGEMRENYIKLLSKFAIRISNTRAICNLFVLFNLSEVSSVLVATLERTLQMNSQTLDLILQQCHAVYPALFASSPPTSSKSYLAHFKSVSSCPPPHHFEHSPVSLIFSTLPDVSINCLNMSLIKTTLTSTITLPTQKLCLLQGIRWLLTRSPPSQRSAALSLLITSDIFFLNPPASPKTLLAPLLSPPSYLKESLSRLLNTFASFISGRQYLTSSSAVISILIKSLPTFDSSPSSSFICHMIVATLQKLSLRREMRLYMIEHQVIPWMVRYMKTELDSTEANSSISKMIHLKSKNNNSPPPPEPSSYLMEYSWALLMNLCLHPESIQSSLKVDFEFLHCIITMLSCRSTEYTPYVLSTFFSLLRDAKFFDKAKSMDFPVKVGPFLPYQPSDIQRHLNHLFHKLEDSSCEKLDATGETDYDDSDNPDPEEVEPELELPESWIAEQNSESLTGDELLIKEYMTPKEQPLLPVVSKTPPPPPLEDSGAASSFSYHTSRDDSVETPPSK